MGPPRLERVELWEEEVLEVMELAGESDREKGDGRMAFSGIDAWCRSAGDENRAWW